MQLNAKKKKKVSVNNNDHHSVMLHICAAWHWCVSALMKTEDAHGAEVMKTFHSSTVAVPRIWPPAAR